jgi:hypothetical protein
LKMEQTTPLPEFLSGLITGTIDTQLALALLVSTQLQIEPLFLSEVFARTAALALNQGGDPEFVKGRQFAALSLQHTLAGLGLPKRKPNDAKRMFEVIIGGMPGARASVMAGDGETGHAGDGDNEHDQPPSEKPTDA